MQSLSCKSCTFGSGSDAGPLQDVVLCEYEANWASQALTRTSHPGLTRPAAQYFGLKGCLVLHQCYLVLLACKKIKLTPFKNKLELTYLAPARIKVTPVMSIRPKMQEARERLKKTRSLCVVCHLLGMFRSRQ